MKSHCKRAYADILYFIDIGNNLYADILKKAHMNACGSLCDIGALVGATPVANGTPIAFDKPISGKFKNANREFVIEKVTGENAVIRYKGERSTYDVKVKDLQNEKDVILDKPLPDANGNSSNTNGSYPANGIYKYTPPANSSGSSINSAVPVSTHPAGCICGSCTGQAGAPSVAAHPPDCTCDKCDDDDADIWGGTPFICFHDTSWFAPAGFYRKIKEYAVKNKVITLTAPDERFHVKKLTYKDFLSIDK